MSDRKTNVTQEERADLFFDIPTGETLFDTKGRMWVLVGWVDSLEGHRSAVWVREAEGIVGTNNIKDRLWVRTMSTIKSMMDFFPDVDQFARTAE